MYMNRRDLIRYSFGSIVALCIPGDVFASQDDKIRYISANGKCPLSFLWGRVKIFDGEELLSRIQFLDLDYNIAYQLVAFYGETDSDAYDDGNWFLNSNWFFIDDYTTPVDGRMLSERYPNGIYYSIDAESSFFGILRKPTKISLEMTQDEFSRYGHMIHDNISIEIKKDFE